MKKSIVLIPFVLLSFFMKAQGDDTSFQPKNIIKTNITSIALKNYSFQYERVLGRRTSLSLSYRFMPETGVPLKSFAARHFDDSESIENDVLNELKVSNYALTPEFRYYFGKGYGRGFYAAVYYRYADFGIEGYNVTFDKEDGTEGSVKISGDVKSHSGGIMFGAQWALGKYVVIDWWIAGVHLGTANGTLNGYSQEDLSIIDQQNIRQEIEDFDFFDKVVFTDKNNVKVELSGPWAGLRMGLSLGVRF